jgi:hypothetical protein
MTIEEVVASSEYKEIIKFLKKEKLYHIFLSKKYRTSHVYDGYYKLEDILLHAVKSSSSYCDFALEFVDNEHTWHNHLVISQFWRFFLFEEIKNGYFKPSILELDYLMEDIKRCIESNGPRNNETLKELFTKYGFKDRKFLS